MKSYEATNTTVDRKEFTRPTPTAPTTETIADAPATVSEAHVAENPATPPKKKRKLLPLIVGGTIAVAAVATVVPYYLHAARFESTDDAFVEAHVIQLGSRTAGQVTDVLMDDNQHVNAGDVLAKIDSRDAEAKVAEAQAVVTSDEARLTAAKENVNVLQANISAAKADLLAAQAVSKNAADELARVKNIGVGAASGQEINNAQAAADRTAAEVEAARAKIVAAEAQLVYGRSQVAVAGGELAQARTLLRQREIDLSDHVVTAPQAGRVTRKSVEAGAYVNVGQALLAVVPDDVWVVANFKETQLTHMRPGQKVTVEVDAYPDHEFKGHVDSIQSGTGSRFSLLPPENATGNYVKVVQRVPVKIVLDDKVPQELTLAPGMSVEPVVAVR